MRTEWRERLEALADAYEPGMYALCDGVYHVYADVPECCQTLRDDIRAALRQAQALEMAKAGLEECSNDLEAEINARAAGELPRRIYRDLEAVERARTALATVNAALGGTK